MNGSRTTFAVPGPFKMENSNPGDSMPSSTRREMDSYRPSKVEYDDSSRTSTVDDDSDVAAVCTRLKAIRIGDKEAVTKYLLRLLELLQQQADKILAKLWIKGICPRKQARYPYKTKQQHEDPGSDYTLPVPEFWPIHVCRFTEPDHVNKTERMNLCLHILRHRATYQQWQAWNQDINSTNKIFETQGWTAFLQSLTPDWCLDSLGKADSEEKGKQRQKIMDTMYKVAREEEAYYNGERDGDDILQVEVFKDAEAALNKKSQSKKRVKHGREFRDCNQLDLGRKRQKGKRRVATYEIRRKRTAPVEKKTKLEPQEDIADPFRSSSNMYSHRIDLARVTTLRCKPTRRSDALPHQMEPNGHQLFAHPAGFIPDAMHMWPGMDCSASSEESSPLTASFCSSHSSQDGMHEPFQVYEPPTGFGGRQDFTFEEQKYGPRPLQIFNVADVPHSYVETVPNTPSMSPTKFEHPSYARGWFDGYHPAPVMEPYPERMSAQFVRAYGAPVPVSQATAVASGTPYAQGAFFEHVNPPPFTPTTAVQPAHSDLMVVEYNDVQHHGLPLRFYHDHRMPEDNDGQQTPFAYPEPTPDANFPPGKLPSSVVRGFTGTCSGVGGGAWT